MPIYYESRISRLSLNAAELPKFDAEFEEITEGEELTKKEKLKSKWAALEALVGDPKRIQLVAADMVAHFEKRWAAMDGKAMIVCMSRRIAVDLYSAIIALRPDWASAKDDDAEAEKGKACVVKVVMTGSADDGPDWQPHIRNKDKRRKLANRFKDAKDPFRIVIVRDMWLTGFNWDKWTTGKPAERLALLPAGQEHILAQEDGKQRWVQVVMELSSAFALCASSDEAVKIRDNVSYFQALQAALNKRAGTSGKSPEQIDAAIRQLVSSAITTDGEVIDVFTAAGLAKPDISILSDQFLAELRGLKHKNVAAELLEKLLKDELKVRSKRNLVQSQVFSEKLKKTLNGYHNRAISTLQVIEELIKLAKDLDAATKAGQEMGLTEDEKAFYDALAANESALTAMGDDKLKVIAAELITQVRKSVTIDWTLRESARAKIKVMVKRILNRYGYPPDLQEEAVKTVLAQAELLCADWAVSLDC